MYNIELFAKNQKKIGDSYKDYKNKESGNRNRIWDAKICQVNNEKQSSKNDRRNRTTKGKQNQDDQRKGNLQVLKNIGRGHRQVEIKEKKI